jgi:uncharacterized membrane protein YdjX (TVP38/TMEM64 family)
MSKRISRTAGTKPLPSAIGRALVVLLLIAGLVLLASSDQLHAWLIELLSKAESIIRARPVLGMLIFTLLAAASAMLAFFSSAIIIPVGVYVWGEATSMLLLWIGWIMGGVFAYTISRYLGRPVVNALSSGPALEQYEHRVSRQAPFGLVLLFQLALPSELPGYLLGIVRYPFWKYLGALALAELPYAVANIYLGTSFIERRIYPLIGMAVALAAFSGWALYTLHRRFSEKRT